MLGKAGPDDKRTDMISHAFEAITDFDRAFRFYSSIRTETRYASAVLKRWVNLIQKSSDSPNVPANSPSFVDPAEQTYVNS